MRVVGVEVPIAPAWVGLIAEFERDRHRGPVDRGDFERGRGVDQLAIGIEQLEIRARLNAGER